MTNKEQSLWDSIKAGNHKFVKIIDSPITRYLSMNDDGYVDFSNTISTKKMNLTLSEVIEQNPSCKLFIYPPSEDNPYWFEMRQVCNPNNFEVIGKMCPYLRVGVVYLTESQLRYEDRLFEDHQNNKKELYEKDKEYESIFIDNFDYRRNRLMLLLTN